MLRTEFHCHTIYSKDSLTHTEKLVETCRRKGIDRVVITDHNSILGAIRAHELDPELVIVGEEIMTQKGELLAAYVQEEVPAGLHPQETIDILRQQGAFISVSHPFDRMRKGHWQTDDLLEIIDRVDAIEIFNARCMFSTYNLEAEAFARHHQLLGTAGSDAHTLSELGKATLLLPAFHDAASLKDALRQAQPQVGLLPPWVHFSTRWAVIRKRLARRLKGG